MKRILATGGAGFIGSNFVRHFIKKYPQYQIVILDALTYAGNLENFSARVRESPNFFFWHGDIRDRETVENIMRNIDICVHFAAESHIDRSIERADEFIDTDVKGTQVLLDSMRRHPIERFIHISTSEVYGSAQFIPITEEHPLKPQSPYAASKTGGDRLAYSYFVTYQLPIVIIRPFNNYGPNQYPEKLIPLFITNAIDDLPLPVYGTGKNTRDWMYVEDHCEALDLALHSEVDELAGEVINLGTGKEQDVLSIAQFILDRLGKSRELLRFVSDRPGHVERLCASTEKAKKLLGWEAKTDFQSGLAQTIDWYLENQEWWRKIKAKRESYLEFYRRQYKELEREEAKSPP